METQPPAPRLSGNPIFPGWYADPEMHIFAGRYYLYPTYSADYGEQTFFEAWSSSDLTDWRSEGRILDFADVSWSTNRAAWAPSAIERNGRYYFYFSAGDGAGLGVAVADHPAGPFRDALGRPLVGHYPHGAQPIDAHAFLDEDGQAYLYFGGHRHAVVIRLNEDMVSLDGDFLEITPENYVEGPFLLKRRGVYYFMWSEACGPRHVVRGRLDRLQLRRRLRQGVLAARPVPPRGPHPGKQPRRRPGRGPPLGPMLSRHGRLVHRLPPPPADGDQRPPPGRLH